MGLGRKLTNWGRDRGSSDRRLSGINKINRFVQDARSVEFSSKQLQQHVETLARDEALFKTFMEQVITDPKAGQRGGNVRLFADLLHSSIYLGFRNAPNEEIRTHVRETLVPQLRGLLVHEHPRVRLHAVRYLEKVASEAGSSRGELEERMDKETDPLVKERIESALREIPRAPIH